ncbi:MAG: dTDP-glucose 4,6-dehydratase [Candidatus Pacebacteria bacterium RIFOXYB1_FULL_39_46]|nr:MAG: dTDP-glucose 4,6-dehydratase [Candidatus Pacebacteria bacterium RIFOXYA1_FULL_38_18]OGJ37905.1 MAG: dTDP-glucose 4,6-dehydratase [Candidatus Pacebacteria bacterium RIFOXYB1_FULL_39_46]OGJ39504.1 MAG: dTDP-glucose 4,6-dehydratase [Candidatus Pacebacteria bacterium RIFOXYC1_FULL_39_21]OGJ40084.1 MAG: dTDP-glucose 4,6-dehydratase [Candidatus Pacebacteria bacterium RIFOXYD1_FULL_39_27]
MSQTILVTGGAGFIGANFIHYWFKNHPEDQIINLDVLTYAGNLDNLTSVNDLPNYTFVRGDIRDKELVNKIMDEIDVVVHFAAESHVDRSIKNPEIFLETNIIGTQILLESALKHNLKRFHHISTDEVFGALPLNTTEKFTLDTPYNPHSPYSASKAAADHLVRAYGTTYGLPYTITNCTNNYGPFQFPEKFIALTITNLLEGKKIPVYGDGLYVRDWLHTEDHCRAIDRVLADGKLGKTYLVGGMTKDVSNLEISRMILEIMGESEDKIEHVKDRPGHDRRYAIDWSETKAQLGWEPSITLQKGLEQTVKWYQENQAWWKKLKQTNQQYFTEHYKN